MIINIWVPSSTNSKQASAWRSIPRVGSLWAQTTHENVLPWLISRAFNT